CVRADAGVVDEAEQSRLADASANLARRTRDRSVVAHVEDERHERVTEFGSNAIGIARLAHAAEYAQSTARQQARDCEADPARYAGHDDRARVSDALSRHVVSPPSVPARQHTRPVDLAPSTYRCRIAWRRVGARHMKFLAATALLLVCGAT